VGIQEYFSDQSFKVEFCQQPSFILRLLLDKLLIWEND
jgi:hypothetical protein